MTHQAKRVMEAVATFWFPQKYTGKAISFLSILLSNMEYVFLPLDLKWIDSTSDANSLGMIELSPVEDETVFTLERSFHELHSLANKPPVDSSIQSFLDRLYSPFNKTAPSSFSSGTQKWFSSLQLFMLSICWINVELPFRLWEEKVLFPSRVWFV